MLRLCLSFLLLLAAAAESLAASAANALHVSIFPRRPASDTRVMFQPLAEFLSGRLGVPVVLETPVDYPSLSSALGQERYGMVHYNQYPYVRAKARLGHRIIAKNEEFGRPDISSVVLVRSAEPYASLRELRGHKNLFGGGRRTMVSYVPAIDMLRNAGLQEDDYIAQFAQNPVKALTALHYMQGDAAAAGDVSASLPLVTEAIGNDRLKVLGQSRPIRHLPWAFSARVEANRAQAIRQALPSLNDSATGKLGLAELQLTGLRPANDAEYDGVREVLAHVLGETY